MKSRKIKCPNVPLTDSEMLSFTLHVCLQSQANPSVKLSVFTNSLKHSKGKCFEYVR